MTYQHVYIGELGPKGGLDWGGDPHIANAPKCMSPSFPPTSDRPSPHNLLKDRISQGAMPGLQADWGAWATRTDKRQILAYCYGAQVIAGAERLSFAHLDDQLRDLLRFVEALEEGRLYALVASEL
jgi:hypothetical protein